MQKRNYDIGEPVECLTQGGYFVEGTIAEKLDEYNYNILTKKFEVLRKFHFSDVYMLNRKV